MAKNFELLWLCEEIQEDPSYFAKRMFGGMAIYLHGKMMMHLAEDPGNNEFRGVEYDYEIWNGLLFPTEREFHESMQEEFPSLISHPVLPKWLYLPMAEKEFESIAQELVEKIAKNDPRFGILPKEKKKKTKKKASKKKKVAKKKTKKKLTKKAAKKVKKKTKKKRVR